LRTQNGKKTKKEFFLIYLLMKHGRGKRGDPKNKKNKKKTKKKKKKYFEGINEKSGKKKIH